MNPAVTLAFVFVVLGLCAFSLGCAARVVGYAEADPPPVVVDESPTLVAVEPGLWVVRRYPTAIYHVDGYYWTCSNGFWYRSTSWEGTWVHAEATVVPRSIAYRDHRRFVYYEGHRGTPTRSLPPGHRENPGLRRGHGHGHVSAVPLPRTGVLATVTSTEVIEQKDRKHDSRRKEPKGSHGRGHDARD